ncbi:notch [Echinococcus multilocularis]|uniref:Notch n=1 Tax=Echinococcus multilocularis TaxID=6211 RepID=A0A068XW55_ECHMU|nr:notch [Echinococcus multilocularis]
MRLYKYPMLIQVFLLPNATKFTFSSRGLHILLILLLIYHLTPSDAANACDAQPCKNGATCRERLVPQSIYFEPQNLLPYECDCPFGWEGVNCTVNVDDCKGNPCLNGGQCEDRPNAQFVCHCNEGFIGQKCEFRDPCLDSPCQNNGRCDSSPLGVYQCICPRWYEGQNCEKPKMPCESTYNQCRHGTCETLYEVFETRVQNQTKTASRISGFRCNCDPGWMGVFCDRPFDVCLHHQCQNGAQCVGMGDHYECHCPEGFEGVLCEQPINQAPSNQSNKKRDAQNDLEEHCMLLGCPNTDETNGTCSGRCIQAGCFNQGQLNACREWIDCLEATKVDFGVGQPTCVERYRDGVCDYECAIASCFYDGFDCTDAGSTCPSEQHCTSVYGDGVCQPECNVPVCGFDGGDCLATIDPLFPQVDNIRTGYIGLLLNTDKSTYSTLERTILAHVADLLRAVVRPAIDEKTQQPVILDVDDGKRTRVTFVIDLLPEGFQASPGEIYESIDQAAHTLKAALDTKSVDLPLPVAQLWVAKDPYAPPPGETTPATPGGLPFLRSKDAIGLYIVLCVLSGAVIILLAFIVIQRRPWKQARKRVRTHGIWSPPSLFFSSSGGGGGSGSGGGHSRAPALSTDPGILLQQGHKPVAKTTASQLEDLLQPGGKRARYSPSTTESYQEESHSLLPQKSYQRGYTTLQSSNARPLQQTDPATAVTTELTSTIRASDGLHPLSAEALSKLEVVIRGSQHSLAPPPPPQQQYMHQHHLKRSFSTMEASDFDQAMFGTTSTIRGISSGAEKLQQQDSFVTTRNPLNGETILHLAARMNVGARAIRRLCGTLVSDEGTAASADKTLALLCLDKDGRSPLTASAATDGLETTTALYRLEREAITCSRSAASSHSAPPVSTAESAGASSEKHSTEARRRTRHVESRRSTPLMVSLKAGCTEVTKLLLDEGCSIQGVDETGRNLVHWAAVLNAAPLLTRISHTKGFSRMLEARDDCDRTPLMLAVRENSLEAAQILLEHHAVIDVFDYTDSSPISEAKSRGFNRMLALLMEYKQRRNPSSSGASKSRHPAVKERQDSESSATSSNSEEEATGSEVDTALGGTDNATSSTQYTPHYQNSQISPPGDISTTTAAGSEKWHQKPFCNDTIKPDPSVCSSSSGVLKQEDRISPQTPSTWSPPLMAPSSIKEISPPVTTTPYWQQQQQGGGGGYVENYPYNNGGEPQFPAPFPGTNGYEQTQQIYQRKYREQQQRPPPPPTQQPQPHLHQQQQQSQVQPNGLCSTTRNGRAPVYVTGSQPSSRGMFVVQL